MAWIKMRMDLRDDPAVFRLSKLLHQDDLLIIGRLWAFWSWADAQAVEGRIEGATGADVDRITGRKDFSLALTSVGWLEIGDGFLVIPRHERHNGESAKERALKSERQAKWRQNKATVPSTEPSTAASTGASTEPSTRGEESRVDINPPPPLANAVYKPARQNPSRTYGSAPDARPAAFSTAAVERVRRENAEAEARKVPPPPGLIKAKPKGNGAGEPTTEELDQQAFEMNLERTPGEPNESLAERIQGAIRLQAQ